MKILYVGNKLQQYGYNPTSVETVGPLLAQDYDTLLISDKKNKVARMLHMAQTIIQERKHVKVMIIDTYSTSAFYYSVMSAWLARRFSIPYVLVLRGGNLARRMRGDMSLFKKAHRLVAPSRFMLQAVEHTGLRNAVYIPNSITLADYPFRIRKESKCRLLWVRAFHSIYNPVMAIDVLAILKGAFPDAQLCMIGPDKDGSKEKCREYARSLGLEKNVRLLDRMSKAEWRNEADHYNIFLNTTSVDNTPVSVLEAMALGLPVVTTNVGGIPYLFTHEVNALLVDPGNATGMANEVQRLLTSSSWSEELVLRARSLVEKFDWAHVRTEWLQLIGEASGTKN